jgi:hypothetical protein
MSALKPRTYAQDGIDIWHIVGARNDFGPDVIGICHYQFRFRAPPTATRPREGGICSHCLYQEKQQLLKTQDTGSPA